MGVGATISTGGEGLTTTGAGGGGVGLGGDAGLAEGEMMSGKEI